MTSSQANTTPSIALHTKYQTLRSLYGVRSPFVVSDDRSPKMKDRSPFLFSDERVPKMKERSALSNSQPTNPTYSALFMAINYFLGCFTCHLHSFF